MTSQKTISIRSILLLIVLARIIIFPDTVITIVTVESGILTINDIFLNLFLFVSFIVMLSEIIKLFKKQKSPEKLEVIDVGEIKKYLDNLEVDNKRIIIKL